MMHRFVPTLASRRASSKVIIPQAQVRRWLGAAPHESKGSDSISIKSNNIQDSFRVFDLPQSFQIDEKKLQDSYRQQMKKLHPDKHSQKSSDIKQNLERQAAVVTHAYDTLKRPHARATHLLQLLGRPVDETAEGSKLMRPEFLMEIMEIRQEIEHVLDDSDDNADERLRPLYERNHARIEDTCRQLGSAFKAKNINKASELTAQLQYWNRIEETLREKMDSVK